MSAPHSPQMRVRSFCSTGFERSLAPSDAMASVTDFCCRGEVCHTAGSEWRPVAAIGAGPHPVARSTDKMNRLRLWRRDVSPRGFFGTDCSASRCCTLMLVRGHSQTELPVQFVRLRSARCSLLIARDISLRAGCAAGSSKPHLAKSVQDIETKGAPAEASSAKRI
jgi:hypothetical protein